MAGWEGKAPLKAWQDKKPAYLSADPRLQLESLSTLPQVAPVLKERMVKEGSMMIGYQPHGTRGNFFRVVVANPALTCADMDFLLNELERLGQDL